MKILSIGKTLHHDGLDITSIEASSLPEHHDIELYTYVIINGGDGTIRRVLKQLHNLNNMPILQALSMWLQRSIEHPRLRRF